MPNRPSSWSAEVPLVARPAPLSFASPQKNAFPRSYSNHSINSDGEPPSASSQTSFRNVYYTTSSQPTSPNSPLSSRKEYFESDISLSTPPRSSSYQHTRGESESIMPLRQPRRLYENDNYGDSSSSLSTVLGEYDREERVPVSRIP